MTAPVPGPDGEPRCPWSSAAPEFVAYHDTEWGFPAGDDRRLFEKLSLEGFQSGLSWRTILAKRENFRAAFTGFDYYAIARFTGRDVERLLGRCRHRAPPGQDRGGDQQRPPGRKSSPAGRDRWPLSSGATSRTRRTSLNPRLFRSPPRQPRCPGSSRSKAGSSSARPRCMRSCKPWA